MQRRNLLPFAAVLILIGSVGLLQLSHQARFALLHNVDILQLLGSGMCFGVALAALLTSIKRRERP